LSWGSSSLVRARSALRWFRRACSRPPPRRRRHHSTNRQSNLTTPQHLQHALPHRLPAVVIAMANQQHGFLRMSLNNIHLLSPNKRRHPSHAALPISIPHHPEQHLLAVAALVVHTVEGPVAKQGLQHLKQFLRHTEGPQTQRELSAVCAELSTAYREGKKDAAG
jgi:hypothetical protein